MAEANRMDIAKFRRLGYLEEANRRFFHPIGLALAADIAEDGSETLFVYEALDDPEGWVFDFTDHPDHSMESVWRAIFIDQEIALRSRRRVELIGSVVQQPGGFV